MLGGNIIFMKHVNRILTLSAAMLLLVGVASCSSNGGTTEDTRVADIIAEAEKMDKADLYKKAMEEVNGKDYVVVANSSRMKDSAPAWKEYCQKNYDSTFDFNF